MFGSVLELAHHVLWQWTYLQVCRIKPVVCLFKPFSVSVVKLTYYWQCNLIFNKYRLVRIDYILMKDLSNLLYNSWSVHKTLRCSLLVFHIRVEPSTVEVELSTVEVELTTVDVEPSNVEVEHPTSKSNLPLSTLNLPVSKSNFLVKVILFQSSGIFKLSIINEVIRYYKRTKYLLRCIHGNDLSKFEISQFDCTFQLLAKDKFSFFTPVFL